MTPTSITLRRVIGGREYHAHVSSRGFLSLPEAARYARVHSTTVWRWVQTGKVTGRRGARPVRISELLRFLGRRASPARERGGE